MIPFPSLLRPQPYRPYLLVGGNSAVTESGAPTTKFMDLNGNIIWQLNYGSTVFAVSGNGTNSYTTGGNAYPVSPLGDSSARYDKLGNLITTFGATESYGQVASTDYKGNFIYTGSNDNKVRKWSDIGTEIWQSDMSALVTGVVLDSSDFVYAVDEGGLFRKFSSTGSVVLSATGLGILRAIDVDSSGFIYIAGDAAGVTKLSSTGSQVWKVDANIHAVKVDSSGNVYCGGFAGVVRKYNSSGTLQWTQTHGAIVRGIALDSDVNVYMVGSVVSGDIALRKYNSSGTLLWSKTHNQGLYSVDVS